MTRIKIAQIGICHEHAAAKMQSLRAMPEVYEVVGVVDDRHSPAAKFPNADMSPYEGLTWMTEEELFSIPSLQAVAVETPNLDLVPTAMRCLERGLAMHMDKPGGNDLAQFGQLLQGCRKKNLPFQMGYMLRNNPALQFAQTAIRNGWLGEIFEIQANMSHNYGGDAYQDYLSEFHGGIMFNLGCHLIDMVVAILGRPAGVTPFLKAAPGSPGDAMNNCLVVLDYSQVHVTLSACSREVDGQTQRRFKICGTKGTIELCPLERFDGQPLTLCLTLQEDNPKYSAGTHLVDFGVQHDRYREQLLELARVINREIENPYTYDHDFLVHEVVLSASGVSQWSEI
jgi:predicted dehydrogenase